MAHLTPSAASIEATEIRDDVREWTVSLGELASSQGMERIQPPSQCSLAAAEQFLDFLEMDIRSSDFNSPEGSNHAVRIIALAYWLGGQDDSFTQRASQHLLADNFSINLNNLVFPQLDICLSVHTCPPIAAPSSLLLDSNILLYRDKREKSPLSLLTPSPIEEPSRKKKEHDKEAKEEKKLIKKWRKLIGRKILRSHGDKPENLTRIELHPLGTLCKPEHYCIM